MSAESMFSSEETVLKEILTSSFYAGFTYTEILEFLIAHHRHQISLSTLKRRSWFAQKTISSMENNCWGSK